MRVLTLSDIQVPFIYSPQVSERFCGVDLVISCGDLPYYYLEYIISKLDVPLFFVRGNHAHTVEFTSGGPRTAPLGAIDLHRAVINQQGLLMAGIEGSGWYREGPYQYTQSEMWWYVWSIIPAMLYNRVRYGRFLDVFVTHAPPWGIHDKTDLPHQGIKAFNWFIKVFQPAYHFHGHIHVYRPDEVTETQVGNTKVINTYGYREIDLVYG
jgi:uncharacterized protein